MVKFCLKKAQISIFIVLAVIIIGIFVVFININNESRYKSLDGLDISDNYRAESLKNFVDGCLDSTFNDGLRIVFMQGGFYNQSYVGFELGDLKVPNYWKYGDVDYTIPDKNIFEKSLEMYVDDYFIYCLANSIEESEFAEYVEFGSDKSESKVEILDDKIVLNTLFSINYREKGHSFKLSRFNSKFYYNFKLNSEILKVVFEEQKSNFFQNRLPIGPLSFMSSEFDMNYMYYETGESIDDYYFFVFFNEEIDSSEGLAWGFSMDYDWEDIRK